MLYCINRVVLETENCWFFLLFFIATHRDNILSISAGNEWKKHLLLWQASFHFITLPTPDIDIENM